MGAFNAFKFITTHPLTYDRILSALSRFVRWQFPSRFSPIDIIIILFERVSKLIMRSGVIGVAGNSYVGQHGFNDMPFTVNLLEDTDLSIDIGSNIGSETPTGGV